MQYDLQLRGTASALQRAAGAGCGDMAAIDGLTEAERARLEQRLFYIARRRYRLRDEVAEDVAQNSMLAFLQVRDRYPDPTEHARILIGIMRNKCREHIRRQVRAAEAMKRLHQGATADDGETPVAKPSPDAHDVLHEMSKRESGRLILEALDELRPDAREMLQLLGSGVSRKDLIGRFGLNKNTLDSRLHAYRKELRRVLAARGVRI